MVHFAIIGGLAIGLLWLVRSGLIHIDMSFPWLVAIVVLGFFSIHEAFVVWVAGQLGITYPPLAIVLLTFFILLGLVTVLLIGYSRLRQRQIQIVRYIAAQELKRQEDQLRR